MIRKAGGTLLIIIGLIFLIPEGLDFLNLGLGHYLSEVLGISMFSGILLTYTLIPAVLIVSGAILLPGSTSGILTGLWGKITAVLKRLLSSPWGLLLIAGMLLISYIIYLEVIVPYIESMI